jgi:hypothetical protein
MKTEISHVKLDNGQEIRVVEEGREGSTVFVRPLAEKEIDTGETVKFDPKEEHLVSTRPVYYATILFLPFCLFSFFCSQLMS